MSVIYCVVPEALADELFPKLESYYADDPHVTVIVDRRKSSRRESGSSGGGLREVRDRRRPRVTGELPDGGARGNPGPAAVGVVVSAPGGAVLEEFAERIGVASNNVAEYKALLRGVERAAALGAREAEFVNDSELVAKQINGLYKVKHPAMKPLYEEAIAALRRNFEDRWRIRSVPRAENARADALVNEALDGRR
jgi:ribonuclease HI